MAREEIRAELARVAASLGAPDAVVELETPREKSHGDLATNLALLLAKPLKASPRRLAEQIVAALAFPPGLVASVEIAGPGFINFRLASDQLAGVLRTIIAAGARYGRTQARRAEAGERRVRLGEPDRPAARGARAPGRDRATPSPRCSSGPGGPSRASSTTTTRARRS